MSDIREIKAEDANLLNYMLIPVQEYRQLIKDISDAEQRAVRYYEQAKDYKELVAEYKQELFRVLGVKELKKTKEEIENDG